LKEVHELYQKIRRIFDKLPIHYGFIGYVFDNSPGGKGAVFLQNVDQGDALVAIIRLIQAFNLDKHAVINCILEEDDYGGA